MKKMLIIVLSALIAVGCDSAKKGTIENVNLSFTSNKVHIEADYPSAVGYPAGEQINTIYDTLMRSYLTWEPEIDLNSSYDKLIEKIDTTFKSYESETMVFEMRMGWSGFENEDIVSILSATMIFAGGAHPNTFLIANNFWRKDGKLLQVSDLIEDQEVFRKILIDKFCVDQDLPSNATMEQTNLLIELADLPISNNIRFTEKGLNVIYNQYDIAPYVVGQITIDVPYDLIKFKEGFNVDGFVALKGDISNDNSVDQKDANK